MCHKWWCRNFEAGKCRKTGVIDKDRSKQLTFPKICIIFDDARASCISSNTEHDQIIYESRIVS